MIFIILIFEVSSLGLELPSFGLGLGFYDKVPISVSSRHLNKVSISEVAVSTTSLDSTTISDEQIKKASNQLLYLKKSWLKFLPKSSEKTLSNKSKPNDNFLWQMITIDTK